MNLLDAGLTPKMRALRPRRSEMVAALDIGTSKIVCLVGRLRPRAPQDVLHRRTHSIEVIGASHTQSAGMKAGTVVDLVAAEAAVRQAIAQAEKAAGLEIESVVVSVSSGRIGSSIASARAEIGGQAIAPHHIAQVMDDCTRAAWHEHRAILHALPLEFNVDGQRGVRDPRGMLAQTLSLDMSVMSADTTMLRNMLLLVARCHLDVEAVVAAPYAAGLAALADEESELGAAVVELGAGTTATSFWSGGKCIFADGFGLGGHHVTMDLARGLEARLADAERIKTLHGGLVAVSADEREMIAVPGAEEAGELPHMVSKAAVTRIIRPRVEEILEMVRDRLALSAFAHEPRARVVLTGGASQLTGMADLAARVLKRPVRLGRPLGVARLPEQAKGPAFSVASGLLVYPQFAHLEHTETRHTRQMMTGTDGYFTRVGRWLRDSF